MHLEFYYCSSVLKTFEYGFLSGKKYSMLKKFIANFQKQKSFLVSSRKCTKSYYCPRTLKTFRIWPFLEKQIDRLKKKTFWKLSKTLNFASFFFECFSKVTFANVFWRRSKHWVFWKQRCFFRKKQLKFF